MRSKKKMFNRTTYLLIGATLMALIIPAWYFTHSYISASSIEGHVFPLASTTKFGGDWLADRCFGSGSGEDHAHGGTDIMHEKGENVQVFAIVDGYIHFSDTNHIRLVSTNKKDKYTYYYNHLSSTKVKKGDKVKAGQLIGYSGGYNAGAQGDHTHFGILTKPDGKVEVPIDSCGIKASKRSSLARKQGLVDPVPLLKKLEKEKSKVSKQKSKPITKEKTKTNKEQSNVLKRFFEIF